MILIDGAWIWRAWASATRHVHFIWEFSSKCSGKSSIYCTVYYIKFWECRKSEGVLLTAYIDNTWYRLSSYYLSYREPDGHLALPLIEKICPVYETHWYSGGHQAATQDVWLYIEGRIPHEPQLSIHVQMDQMLQEYIVNKIVPNVQVSLQTI